MSHIIKVEGGLLPPRIGAPNCYGCSVQCEFYLNTSVYAQTLTFDYPC